MHQDSWISWPLYWNLPSESSKQSVHWVQDRSSCIVMPEFIDSSNTIYRSRHPITSSCISKLFEYNIERHAWRWLILLTPVPKFTESSNHIGTRWIQNWTLSIKMTEVNDNGTEIYQVIETLQFVHWNSLSTSSSCIKMTEIISNSYPIYPPGHPIISVCTLKLSEYKYLMDRDGWIYRQ